MTTAKKVTKPTKKKAAKKVATKKTAKKDKKKEKKGKVTTKTPKSPKVPKATAKKPADPKVPTPPEDKQPPFPTPSGPMNQTPTPGQSTSPKDVSLQPKTKNVKLSFILDRSGSMNVVKADTIGGFNQYLKNLRELKDNKFDVSLVQFDDVIETVYSNIPLSKVEDLTEDTFHPRGMTALNDATGRTINDLPSDLEADTSSLVIIFTDGQENASKEYSGDKVKNLIIEKEKTGKFTVVYLGSTPASVAEAARYGIAAGNTVMYSQQNMKATMSNLAHATGIRGARASVGMTATRSFFKDAGIDESNISVPTPKPEPAKK